SARRTFRVSGGRGLAFGSLYRGGSRQPALPHLPLLVGLPVAARAHVQGGQPAPTVAVGVDADEMPQVEDLPALLRRVADDGDLPRGVRARPVAVEGPPPQHAAWLLAQVEVRLVAGVDEQVRFALVVVLEAVDEGTVPLRDAPRMSNTVRPQGLVATTRQPGAEVVLPSQGV